MMKKPRKLGKIFKIGLSSTTEEEVLAFVELSLKKKHKFFVTTPNPEILIEARKNNRLAEAINLSDIALPDGVGIRFFESVKIIKGREMMIRLFELADKEELRIFILGSTKKIIELSIIRFNKEYPDLEVRGAAGPKLDKDAKSISLRDSQIYKNIIRDVNVFKPDLLFIAYGAPKQEIWVKENLGKLKVGGVMTVGGSLDYFSGEKKLPPKIFETLYIEWLWRLLMEFGRPGHFRRIYNAVAVFPILVIFEKLRGKEREKVV
jgi:N-acetylglucosaminyldiphosphoundecaprenol N-acetyl-beta-D-mannosaminyltransferase